MKVVFGGGLDEHAGAGEVEVEADFTDKRVKDLILYVNEHVIDKGYRHFASGDDLGGGILCLVNGVDWEVFQEKETPIANTDTIHFISTMHGG